MVYETGEQTDRKTDRQTDLLIAVLRIPPGDEVNVTKALAMDLSSAKVARKTKQIYSTSVSNAT